MQQSIRECIAYRAKEKHKSIMGVHTNGFVESNSRTTVVRQN